MKEGIIEQIEIFNELNKDSCENIIKEEDKERLSLLIKIMLMNILTFSKNIFTIMKKDNVFYKKFKDIFNKEIEKKFYGRLE
jgi:hypothetical protein